MTALSSCSYQSIIVNKHPKIYAVLITSYKSPSQLSTPHRVTKNTPGIGNPLIIKPTHTYM